MECLEEKAFECASSVFLSNTYYCSCLLRVYIVKKLMKARTRNGRLKWGCIPKWKPGTSSDNLLVDPQNAEF